MESRKFFVILIGILILLPAFVFVSSAKGQDISGISYPISELGNCGSKVECKAFCDDLANYVACAQWAAKNGVMPEEKVVEVKREVEQAEKFDSGEISEGPGGCKTPEECDAYCQKPEHGEECFKFGLEHNLISPEEAKQIQKQVEESKGPGGCKTNEECDAFCAKPENAEACVNYSVKEGTLSADEAREALEIMKRERIRRESMKMEEQRPEPRKPKVNEEKMAKALKKQGGPGGCKTVQECKEYCNDLSHAEECLSFAEKNSLVPAKDLKEMKAMAEVMVTTGGPGGCKTPKECDEYCMVPEHQSECLEFAKKHNLISPEELEKIEKMGGGPAGGPGGCKNQVECDAYCSNPQHMEECLMFSVKQGAMSKEEAQRMIEIMKEQERRGLMLKGAPPTEEMSPYKELPHMFKEGMPKENEWPGPEQLPENYRPPEGYQSPRGFEPPDKYQQQPPENYRPPEGRYQPPEKFKPPEGNYQPPEGYQPPKGYKPPEGYGPPGEFKPPEGYVPPEGYKPPEGYQPPAGYGSPEGYPMGPQPPEGIMPPPEGVSPPPEESPQSLLKGIKHFLADIGSFLNLGR